MGKRAKPVKIIADNQLWFERRLIKKPREFKDRYQLHIYDERSCAKCEYLEDRHSSICDDCPAHLANLKMWKQTTIDGKKMIGVPTGNPDRLSRVLDRPIKITDDRRCTRPFRHPIRFTGNLYEGEWVTEDGVRRQRPNQKKLVRKFLKAESGLIKAPPRTGKTVLGTAIACALGYKTLIIAHQKELLKQFYWTFVGSRKRKKRAMTNIPKLRRKTGKRIIDIVEKPEDLKGLDIALINYQKFISKYGPERIERWLKDKWGFIVVDEAHQGGAIAYSRFLNSLNPRRRLGLTATPKRKDGRHLLTTEVIGPTVAESFAVGLTPTIRFIDASKIRPRSQHRSWTGMVGWLAKNEDWHRFIVKRVFRDLNNGARAIIIPVDYRQHQDALVNMINDRARKLRAHRREKWPEKLAVSLHGKSDRESVLHELDHGSAQVIVSIRSMIKQGIDMAKPDTIYIVVPMSASQGVGAPMFEQLAWRVGTPAPGKIDPVVKIIVPDAAIAKAAYKGLYFKEILPKARGKRPKYKVDDKTSRQADKVLLGRTVK